MNDTSQIVLKNAGDGVTLHVTAAELATIGKYPEVWFSGTYAGPDGVAKDGHVRMPQSSAYRQLDRLGCAQPAEVVGWALTFTRDENTKDASKPFWGITLADGGKQRVPPAPVADAPTTPAPRAEAMAESGDRHAEARQRIVRQYLDTMQYVAAQMTKIAYAVPDAPIPLDMGHVQAATFSLYHTMDQKGLLAAPLAAPPKPAPAPVPKRAAVPAPVARNADAPPPRDFDDFPTGPDDDELPF